MPKGTITMRGRIMAGSQAVIGHNEAGYAVFVASHPPDIHLSRLIVAYGHKVVEATGSTGCVIDRAVNSLAGAVACTTQDWGVLCRLDDHEHQGLERCATTPEGSLDDGRQVESGSWKAPTDDDPRLWVIVVPTEGKPFVSWGTPQRKATVEVRTWPPRDRERTERQANSFTRLIDHGARETHDGRKTIVGPDRQQQRQREDLGAS